MAKQKMEPEMIARLNRLCELGARPPVIQAMLPTVPEPLLRSQWEIINGEPAKKGRLPNVPDWYFSTYQIKLQSSFCALIYKKLLSSDLHYIDAYIATYEIYSQTFEERLMSFDRVWFLGRILSAKMVKTTVCDKCHSVYIHHADNLINHKHCPVCHQLAQKPEAQKLNTQPIKVSTKKTPDYRPYHAPILARNERPFLHA